MNPTTDQADPASAPALPDALQKLANSHDLPSRVIEHGLQWLVDTTDSPGALLWMSADPAGQDLKPMTRVGEVTDPLLDARSGPRNAVLPALRQAWSLRKRTAIGPGQASLQDTPLYQTTQFLVPVLGHEGVLGVIHLLASADGDPKQYEQQIQPADQLAQALGQYLARRQGQVAEHQVTAQREMLKLIRQLVRAQTPREVLSELANYSRSLLEAHQAAAVGFVGLRTETVFSEVVEVNRRAVRVRTAQALAEAARQRGVPLTYSRDQSLHGEDEPLTPTLHQYFEMTDASAVVLLPLVDEQRVAGVLIVEYLRPNDASERAPVQQMVAEEAGPVLARCVDEHRRPLRRTARVLEAVRDRPWRAGVIATLVVTLLAGVVAGLFAVPVPLDIRVDGVLEPRQRATVSAPFEGRIEQVLVEPGQAVEAGSPLLRFDSRDWQLQMAELTARIAAQRVEADAAMARGEQAEARAARLQVEGMMLQRQQIERRLDRAELQARIRGVVISGDLRELEGRDVRAGQELFELGDLDQFDLVLKIPERELPLVERALAERGDVGLWFLSRAWPELLQEAAVTEEARLLPTSIAEEDEGEPTYHLIVPLELAETESRLALADPTGRAKLNVGEASVAYRYFRRAWHYLRMQLMF